MSEASPKVKKSTQKKAKHLSDSGTEKSAVIPLDGYIKEIIAPRQSGIVLHRNVDDFKLILNNIPAVVFKGYNNGAVDFFDHKVEEMTGYPRQDFNSRRRKWTDLIVKSDVENVKQVFIKALKTDRSYVREYRIKNKKKKVIWIQERSHIVCDQYGKIQYVSGILFDITQRKQAEEAIQEGERFLSNIFTSIQDGISVIDMDLCIVQVNPTMEKWYAHAMPLVGKRCYEAYHGQEEPCRPCPSHRTIITREPHFETVARRGSDGKSLGWLDVYTFPWISKTTGKMKGVIKYVRDVTYRLQAQDTIEESLRKLQKTLNGTVRALASTVETRDPYTAGHQRRVVQLACAIAQEMGLSEDVIEGLKVMGFLHDIGKIAIPAEILSKPSQLSEYEFNIIKTHPQTGYDILKEIEFPWPVAQAVLQHHERFNGSGYPLGVSGQDIILEARILAVADVAEAMASHRPYRPSLGLDQALDEIFQSKGILYDPAVVDACLKLFSEDGFIFD
jgi:PAS domain S-box-containing protein/putative nucleotidyltransferase with HDIG domain